MDVLVAASQLGEAIVESEVLKAWKASEAAVMKDEKSQNLMQEFRELQMEMVKASRDNREQQELEKVRDNLLAKQNELNEYELTREYFQARQAFEGMMQSINDILSHYMNGGQEGGCSGSCSSCSGCH